MENNIFELQYALNTFYFLVMGILVMWMAAGFSMLEAGMVRSKNTNAILIKNILLYAVSCTMYLVIGYELMYQGGILLADISLDGTSSAASFTKDILTEATEATFAGNAVYSDAADFFFQVVFVATAMSVVSGAVAERMKLFSFLLFAIIFTAIIYPVEGSWTWGGADVFGMFNLSDLHFSDFAGSGIVHMAGASAALAGVLVLGARSGKYETDGQVKAIVGSNMPLSTIGVLILWMGWFGFNGGSVLKMSDAISANSVAIVILNTNAAAAAGTISSMIIAKIWFGKTDLTMVLNGALAGLVAITAEPLAPSPIMAVVIGAIGGALVVPSIVVLDIKLKIDDPVGAISVHGIVGLWGLMAVPLTNSEASFSGQIIGAATIFIWVFFASLMLWLILKKLIGLRVSEDDEFAGLDMAECGIEAYPEFDQK